MSVTVAKTAGFCFGVRRAVDLAEQQARQGGEIYAYGEIIHNMHEIARLEKMGVHTAQTISGIPDGERVLIRAHGVARSVYDAFRQKNCEIYDATCPFVQKIHRIVDRESRDGRLVLILGKEGHPEVEGIRGWCSESVVIRRTGSADVCGRTGARVAAGLPCCPDHGKPGDLEYFCVYPKKKVYKPQNF